MTDFLHMLPTEKRQPIENIVLALKNVPGVRAIVLGGSYARGCAHAQSDIDLGIYYHDTKPFDILEIKKIAQKFDISGNQPVVSGFYEWGRWVNGGTWIQTSTGKVDILYRSIDHVERVINDAHNGKIEWDFEQQPPFGFYSVTYLAETNCAVVLYDSENIILNFKERVKIYPLALKKAIIKYHLWCAEFSLMQAKKFAESGDLYSTAGSITRIMAYFTQVLFAINEIYFMSDKNVLDIIENFTLKPAQYKQRVNTILEKIGENSQELVHTTEHIHILFREIKTLAGDLYEQKYQL